MASRDVLCVCANVHTVRAEKAKTKQSGFL